MSEKKPLLTVLIPTLDEEENLPACLESVEDLPCETVVVDSGSDDETQDIARNAGAQIVETRRGPQADIVNWALDNVDLKGKWVLRLDADERLTDELVDELASDLPGLPPEVTGLDVKRRVHFLGRWSRHGGYYPTWILRVWRNGEARAEDRRMDEHMVLQRGRAERLTHDIWEENANDLEEWTARQNRYSTREADAYLAETQDELAASIWGGPAARKRWLKQDVYYRLPAFVRAWMYFVYRYVLRFGFLDGKEGLVFHFLQGFWHRFLIDAKIAERRSDDQDHE